MISGGIDIGGTKIEARLFDGPQATTVETHRIATPKDSYAAMLDVVIAQIGWLTDTSGAPDLPIGIAVPGIVDPVTGQNFAANIPANGRALGPDLQKALGTSFVVVNDCMAFALSEADGGAGDAATTVMGLVLGTGLGGGICINRRFPPRHQGLAVEIGHVGLPAEALARHALPLLSCGCGRKGCMETYVSGTGLANIAEQKRGHRIPAETLRMDADADLFMIWADLAGECLLMIQLTLAPDCIVLGGGLSNLPGVADILTESLRAKIIGNASTPHIVTALHGDSSGARGAALLACKT